MLKKLAQIEATEKSSGPLWQAIWDETTTHDGEHLLLSVGGRTVDEWKFSMSTSAFKLCQSLDLTTIHEKSLRRIAVSKSQRLLAVTSFDSSISIFRKSEESSSWVFSSKLSSHESEAKGVAFGEYGENDNLLLLATTGRDQSIWLYAYDLKEEDFYCINVFSEHTQDVKSVSFHPKKLMLATASYDETVGIYAIAPPSDHGNHGDDPLAAEWHRVQTLEHSSTVWETAFSPDGKKLASCSADGIVQIWTSETPATPQLVLKVGPLSSSYELIRRKEKDANLGKWVPFSKYEIEGAPVIYSIDWNSTSDKVAIAGGDGYFRIFKVDEGCSLTELAQANAAHSPEANSVRWNKNGEEGLLVTCGDDGLIKVWQFLEN